MRRREVDEHGQEHAAGAGALVERHGRDRVGAGRARDLRPAREPSGDEILDLRPAEAGHRVGAVRDQADAAEGDRREHEAGRVVGCQRAAREADVDDPAGGVGDAGAGPAADDREARRGAHLAPVEVREVGGDGRRRRRAAHRDRARRGRRTGGRGGGDRHDGKRHETHAGGHRIHTLPVEPTPPPRRTPRLPARTGTTRRDACESVLPPPSSASTRSLAPRCPRIRIVNGESCGFSCEMVRPSSATR